MATASSADIQTLLETANALRLAGQPAACLDRLQKAREHAAGDPGLLAAVAGGFWRYGRLADAADILAAALARLERSPYLMPPGERAALLTRLGAARIRLGELDQARQALHAGLELYEDGFGLLQLGNALRYMGEFDAAGAHLAHAYQTAEAARDGALAIAVRCAQGELALDHSEAKRAVIHFGQALGLTEFSSDEALTVAPLAGLAHAHVQWGNAAKARELGKRALERAERAGDAVGRARALLALGVAEQDLGRLELAENEAAAAPHRPLVLRAMRARLELAWDADLHRHAMTSARRMQMRHDLGKLETIQGHSERKEAP